MEAKEYQEFICFAYYVDDRFVGWYADTFGSVRKTPKVYPNTQEQRDIIERNFRLKIQAIRTSTFEKERERIRHDGIGGVFALQMFDSAKVLNKGDIVELKIVRCPFLPHEERKIRKWSLLKPKKTKKFMIA